MSLTESERRALLASSILVVLAALGRTVFQPSTSVPLTAGLEPAAAPDSALAVAESIYAEAERRRTALATGERIDPNVAGEVELDRLPGVGRTLARAIAASRRSDGPFRSRADLERVPGLGSSKIEQLAPYLTLPDRPGPDEAPGGRKGALQPGRPGIGRQERLNLNLASAEELEALPGIGPVRARAIIRWRDEHGPFRNIEALLEVKGLGPATLERLRSRVRTGP